jgi:hypothetical protein
MAELSDETVEFLRNEAWGNIAATQLRQDELALAIAQNETRQNELELADKQVALARLVENRRDSRLSEVLSRYANLAEQLTGLIENGQVSDIIMREGFEEFSAEVKIIKQGLFALLGRDGADMQRVRSQLKQEFAHEETQVLLIKQRRNLQKLKEQEANFGMQAPLYILNDIEQVEAQILLLQEKLLP